MKLSFLPGGLSLILENGSYIICVDGYEVFSSKTEKAALTKFHGIRREMESRYPSAELTKEQKQEALKRLIGDQVLREVRNSTRKSKFDQSITPGRFDNR